MNNKIKEYLQNILKREYDIELTSINLEKPPKPEMWDVAFGCFVLSKELKKWPNTIAEELKNVIQNDSEKISEIERVEALWPYLNVFLWSESYTEDFRSFMQQESLYNTLWSKNKDDTIYIDYIWANVGKPLHIWHMCTPLQWQTIINAYEKMWYNVISDSHICDWWAIFWKLIVAYNKYWNQEELETNAVEHLFQIYVKITKDAESEAHLEQEFRDIFRKLSLWDPDLLQLWESFTKYSLNAMNILLWRLFVQTKYNIWESFYEWLWLPKIEDYPDLKFPMSDLVDELIEKWIAVKNDDNSVGITFHDDTKLPSCILQKRDGTHWYLASDLASVRYRMDNWDIKKIIYFVDVRQQLHFKQVFEVSRLAWWVGDDVELFHAYNGFISLKDGAMSTRKWKIIKLEALLDEAEQRAKNIILEKRDDINGKELEELSKIIGIGAIKYGYLKKTRENDVVFDWDEFMSFEWNSWPYIQYAYVRAKKILDTYDKAVDFNTLKYTLSEEKELIKHILWFEKVIQDMTNHYHPHILCAFVYEMTKKFSSFYNRVPILSESEEILKSSRIALLHWFIRVLQESFEILGIPLPDKM